MSLYKTFKRMILLLFAITCFLSLSNTHAQAAKKTVRVIYDQDSNTLYVKVKKKILYHCEYKKETVYLQKDLSHVRKGPGIKYAKSKSIRFDAGDAVKKVGSVWNNRWAIIEKDDHYYFIVNKYLDEDKPKVDCSDRYSSGQLKHRGVIHWNGWRWTWYSQKRLPGRGLRIPGRHVDKNRFVCDEDGYICLASGKLRKGSIVYTPFGKKGKIYDSGCARGTLDVYTNF